LHASHLLSGRPCPVAVQVPSAFESTLRLLTEHCERRRFRIRTSSAGNLKAAKADDPRAPFSRNSKLRADRNRRALKFAGSKVAALRRRENLPITTFWNRPPGPGMIRRLAARNFSRIWPLCRPLTIAPRTQLHGYACLWPGFPSRATILLASSVGKRTTIMCRFRRWMYLSLALLGLALSGTNAGAQPMACYPVASWTEVTTAVCIKYACRGGGFQIRCLPAPVLR